MDLNSTHGKNFAIKIYTDILLIFNNFQFILFRIMVVLVRNFAFAFYVVNCIIILSLFYFRIQYVLYSNVYGTYEYFWFVSFTHLDLQLLFSYL
jgi:hypothetical protein